jgi:1,4-alpha-glucan branching enzyme
VVHGKRTLLEKMPGDYWQKLANLRAYLGFMWTHPGKKLLFMGCEFGQYQEFDHDKSPQWDLLDDPRHRSIQRLVRDLNGLYAGLPALHLNDTRAEGFSWVVGNDSVNSVFAYFRHGNEADGDEPLLVVVNMTPVPRHNYRIGVPPGSSNQLQWKEILNTDADIYGGSNLGNAGSVTAQQQEWHGYPASLLLTLPPLSTIILRRGE